MLGLKTLPFQRCSSVSAPRDHVEESRNLCRIQPALHLSNRANKPDLRCARTNHDAPGSAFLYNRCHTIRLHARVRSEPAFHTGSSSWSGIRHGTHGASWSTPSSHHASRVGLQGMLKSKAFHVIRSCHVSSQSATPSQSDTWQQERPREAVNIGKDGGSGWLGEEEGEEGKGKVVDMVTLGNLCVDVVVNVDELPPRDREGKWNYMQTLMASPPDESNWEGGGNANTLIAGGRLGLRCIALGHVGDDVFGKFFVRILAEEGVGVHDVGQGGVRLGGEDYDGETLIVWVMLDPKKDHAFCSRFDFNTDPVFSQLTSLPPHAEALIRRSKALFINGFTFDEIPPPCVVSAARLARDSGTHVFFDPGPRTGALVNGSQQSREALEELLKLSSVVLLTEDEAVVLTGLHDPTAAARHLLQRGEGGVQWVVVKQGGNGCVMATQEGIYSLPGFQVEVADTVGCGDSFAAAVVLGFTRGEGARATLALANAVGAATAMGSGAGRNVADAERVERILVGLQADSDEAYGLQTDHSDGNGSVAQHHQEGELKIKGSPECPSGTPLHAAVKDALDLLKRSLKEKTHSIQVS